MVQRDRGVRGGATAAASRSSLEASGSGPGRDWVGFAVNVASGHGGGRAAVVRLTRELDRLGVESRIAWTLEESQRLVDAARAPNPNSGSGPPSCRCLVAVGGDGTVADLINKRPEVPIAVVPAGTENLFARHFGFARNCSKAAARIAEGHPESLDLGVMDGRRFALMAGFGFDADVVSRHHAARVGRAGQLKTTHRAAYVEPVLRSSFAYRFPPLSLSFERVDGAIETLVGTTAFVFNLPRYALGLPFAPSALGNDGWLDLVVFRDPGPFRALHYLWLVVRGLHLNRPGIAHRRVRRVAIEATGIVPVQLDGDPGGLVKPGKAPRIVEVLPKAIDVLVPASKAG
jgi:diacylglycerol kinase (ATP)